MTLDDLEPGRWLALHDELRGSIRLIDGGIAEIHTLGSGNDFYELPLLVLANGLERLIKLTLVGARLHTEGSVPAFAEIAGFKHFLWEPTVALVECVERESDYARRAAVQADLRFVRSDPRLRELLDLLGAFGQRHRYHRLDEVLGKTVSVEDDPYRRWSAMEVSILQEHPEWVQLLEEDYGKAIAVIASAIAQTIDRYTRALARMWLLGGLGESGRRHQPALSPFWRLDDDELGRPRRISS